MSLDPRHPEFFPEFATFFGNFWVTIFWTQDFKSGSSSSFCHDENSTSFDLFLQQHHVWIPDSRQLLEGSVKLTFLIDSAANAPIDRQLQDWSLFGKVLGQEEHGDNITVFQI